MFFFFFFFFFFFCIYSLTYIKIIKNKTHEYSILSYIGARHFFHLIFLHYNIYHHYYFFIIIKNN